MVAIHALRVHIIKFNYVKKLVQLKHIWDTVVTVWVAQLCVSLGKHNSRHLYRKVQLTGCVASMDKITVKLEESILGGDFVETEAESTDFISGSGRISTF